MNKYYVCDENGECIEDGFYDTMEKVDKMLKEYCVDNDIDNNEQFYIYTLSNRVSLEKEVKLVKTNIK